MITVYGEGRGFRVVWLLEEMGQPYKLRGVDLLAGVQNDPEFLAINPAGFIPALVDGDTTMVESIAIMQYLLARHGAADGPHCMAPAVQAANYGTYLQFLHLGEAGLAMGLYIVTTSRHQAPEGEKNNFGARKGLEIFNSRLGLVTRQLARTPYLAGDAFTAADISVGYALLSAQRHGVYTPGSEVEQAYLERITTRPGYQRCMAACHATRGWDEAVKKQRAGA